MRTLHIAVGSLALASMFVPMVAPKGGRLHRSAGWVFAGSMAIVVVTAAILSVTRLIVDRTPGGQASGVFLLYLSVITGSGIYGGLRAVRKKIHPGTSPIDLAIALVQFAGGATVAGYGLWWHQPVFAGLSLIGIVGGIGSVRRWQQPSSDRMQWWFDHMSGMLGGSIAATTAFLVNTTAYTGIWPIAAWLAPTAIGVPGIAMWVRYYERRFRSRTDRDPMSIPVPTAAPYSR